jgi:hypothetical protein
MAQMSFSLNGAFCPTIFPLFQGSLTGKTDTLSMMNSLMLKGFKLWLCAGKFQADIHRFWCVDPRCANSSFWGMVKGGIDSQNWVEGEP